VTLVLLLLPSTLAGADTPAPTDPTIAAIMIPFNDLRNERIAK